MACWTTTPSMWPPAVASRRPDLSTSSAASQPPTRPRPLIEVLTFPSCPHRDAAIALAVRVREQLGSAAEVRVIDLPDQPAAEQARFLGSPTIRVDGHDIEPGALAHCCSIALFERYAIQCHSSPGQLHPGVSTGL